MPRIKTYEASEKRFRAIKTLSENGVPKVQIAKIFDLAESIVWRMTQHES